MQHSPATQSYSMVDQGQRKQQNTVKEMLGQMRMVAEKHGKDWLRHKLGDEPEEGPSGQQDSGLSGALEDSEDTNTEPEALARSRKHRRNKSKAPKKGVYKKGLGLADPHPSAILATAGPTKEAREKATNGEHVSTIVKKCLKSFAPLLLSGTGAVLGQAHSLGRGAGDTGTWSTSWGEAERH
ncbi:hypothetical protein NDU88_006018 [Pleurodeles waltl]|uniref:Uncharacterized protein n=1 Tax=Pleurodeles waltl TaxID=8319 RepID=A0AAV7PKB9_PLEWA|nr:hypothetical protein NDU88_006018 [Pleurodeles waltl]